METIDQHQKIERYILNRMNEEEASQFEAFYLSDKECLEQLKFAEKLHFGLKFISELEDQVTNLPNTKVKASNDVYWWAKKIPIWCTAAILMIAILPAIMFINQFRPHDSSQSNLIVHNLSLATIRSNQSNGTPINESYIQASTGQIILSSFIDTEIERLTYEQYRFTIYNEEKESSSKKQIDVQLDPNDMLYVDLGKNYLKAGRYTYNIIGISKTENPIKIFSGTLIANSHTD